MMLCPFTKLPMLKITSKKNTLSPVFCFLYRPKLTRNQMAHLKSGHAEVFGK